jgi:hypothetical protein
MGLGGFLKGSLLGAVTGVGGLAGGLVGNKKQNDNKKKAAAAAVIEKDRLAMVEGDKLAQIQRGREQDLASGKARGAELFGNNALGRVNEGRSADVASILAQRKANLAGFTPEEQGSMRDQNMKQILAGQQAGSRDLARQQARSGVRGGLASAQQGAMQMAGQGQLADQERQLFLENIAQKRGALDQFEQSTQGAEAADLSKQQYNQSQAARELLGKLSTEMGYGSLGASDRASAMQSALGEKALSGSKDIAELTKGKK